MYRNPLAAARGWDMAGPRGRKKAAAMQRRDLSSPTGSVLETARLAHRLQYDD
jgi:hypothetical protein